MLLINEFMLRKGLTEQKIKTILSHMKLSLCLQQTNLYHLNKANRVCQHE